MIEFSSIFITVGTTQFQDLIDVIISDEILTQFQRFQCKELKIQYGAGREIDSATIDRIQKQYSINIKCFDFKANIQPDIISSDLVISHAGAGSCIEVLTAKKLLIVVVNDKLMDNHQTELAHQLCIDGYLLYCSPSTLGHTLNELDAKVPSLKLYEAGNSNLIKFVDHLNSIMGFE